MKTKSLLLWLMLLVGVMGAKAAEAYAYYEYDDSSLNFSYDNNKSYYSKSSDYVVFSLNTGTNTPAWHSMASSIELVYFNSSFASYKPTSCYKWFSGMSNLEEMNGMSNLNTSNVTRMDNMFYNCSKLTSLSLTTFNTQNVTSIYAMFAGCSKLTSLNLGSFNTAKVTNMERVFENCSGLTSLNLSSFNTSNVTNFYSMFYRCSSLTKLDLSSFSVAKISSTSGLSSFFSGCNALKTLTLSSSLASCSYFTDSSCSGIGSTSSPCTLNYPTSAHLSFSTITADYVVWKGGYFKSSNMKPYAVYYNNVLSFYYDDYASSRSGYVYDLNTGSNRPGWNTYKSYVKSVTFNTSFANARPTSCYEWFSGMTNLTTLSGLTYFNTSKVTTMAYMFKECSSLTNLDLNWSNFITSNVTSMGYLFYGCSNLTNLFISNFNTSNVTDFRFMFYGCSKLSSINVSNFKTAKATLMVSMFQGCSSLTSINVSNFNTSNAKSWMDQMFYGCSKLTSLDISSFTIGAPNAMMQNCTSLTYLKVPSTGNNLTSYCCEGVGTTSKPCTLDYPSGFTPTKEATGDGWYKWKGGYFTDSNTKSAYAFLSSDKKTLTFYYDASRFSRTGGTVYPLNTGSNAPGWHSNASDVTSVVFNSTFSSARPTSCYEWFDGMTNLTSITSMASYLNTSQVTNMAYMFYNCKKLASVALSGFNTANVTSMHSMFYSCNNLASIDVSGFNTAKVTDMEYMFLNCSNLTSLNIGNFNLSSLTVSTQIMRGCTALKTLTIPSTANKFDGTACVNVGTTSAPCTLVYPSGFTPTKDEIGDGWYRWKGGYFKDDVEESYAFLSSDEKTLTFYYDKNRTTRTGGTAYGLNTNNNNPGWYASRTSVKSVVFDSSFANARPTTCYAWFEGMSNLTTITNINYLNTSEVTDMLCMFFNCYNLTSINVSNFNTAKVKDMGKMFYDCISLSTITGLSSFNTSKVYNMSDMFYECQSLTSIDVSKFNTENVEYMDNMFYGCSKLASLDLSKFILGHSFEDGYVVRKVIPHCDELLVGCSSLKKLTIPGRVVVGQDGVLDPDGEEIIDYDLFISPNDLGDICVGVGTTTSPCTLIYPSSFTPEKTSTGNGWYLWKGGYFKDSGGLKGDVNGDGSVSLLDIMMCVDYILGQNPNGFIFANADMDDDKEISLADILSIVDIILTQTGS